MNTHTSPHSAPEQGKQTVIDTKFPLTWLIGCTASIVFTMGGFAVQVSALSTSISKIEAKSDARDDKTSLLQQMFLVQQGEAKNLAATVTRTQADLAELKRDVEELRRNKSWAPK